MLALAPMYHGRDDGTKSSPVSNPVPSRKSLPMAAYIPVDFPDVILTIAADWFTRKSSISFCGLSSRIMSSSVCEASIKMSIPVERYSFICSADFVAVSSRFTIILCFISC